MASVEILDGLRCPLCLDYAHDAKESSCCGQVYCDKCLGDLTTNQCPSCRKDDVNYLPNRAVRRLLSNIKEVCPNGCGQEPTRSELSRHLLLCPNRKFHCPRVSCQFHGLENEFVQHLCQEHKKPLLDSVDSWLCDLSQDGAVFKCPIKKCIFESKMMSELGLHVTEHHTHGSVVGDQVPRVNGAGDIITMGLNGKFYCGKPITMSPRDGCLVFSNCNFPENNCSPCMKTDILTRGLSPGCLVNRDGKVCRFDNCLHFRVTLASAAEGSNRTEIHRVCSRRKCGNIADGMCNGTMVQSGHRCNSCNHARYETCGTENLRCESCRSVTRLLESFYSEIFG